MKILIIHATAGAGHRKAAEALYDGFKGSSHDVTLVDALDYTSAVYKRLYSQTYTFLISKIPFVWGFIFYLIDVPAILPVVRLIRRCQNFVNAQRLENFLKKEQFDCILSTHFFPNEVAAFLKRRGKIQSRIVSIVTDFDVHSIWLSKGVDHYCCASQWTKEKLKQLGIDEQQSSVTGIPVDAKFTQEYDKKEIRQKLGLNPDVFTVLIATGSFGIGPIEEIVDAIEGVQAVVVCGHNKDLYNRLSKEKKELVKVCPLVDNMYELMAAADVMISKPGGLSISEALVRRLPLVFFNAIPGQETNNVRVLREYHVGISNCTIEEIAREIKGFQSTEEKYSLAVSNTENLAHPCAVQDVINLIKSR